ncbi:hypothetical protein R1sor_010856 [Riccia sorocarpa]|uniref:Uncharacterized protein n=1 Tax=Riccia sorocarpa TaxID=122646 RepID=A0ABD3HZ76_9MARC
MEDLDGADPDDTIGDVAADSEDSDSKEYCREHSLQQTGSKLQLVQPVSVHLNLPEAGGSTEIQRTRPLKYPELASHDLAYKLKSWIYTCAKNAALRGDTTPELLTLDIHNVADHWAGNHSTCRTLPGVRKNVTENWTSATESEYAEDGETHKPLKDFLRKYITENKMKYYIRARENYISKTFHSTKTNRVLVTRTSAWKTQLASRVFS